MDLFKKRPHTYVCLRNTNHKETVESRSSRLICQKCQGTMRPEGWRPSDIDNLGRKTLTLFISYIVIVAVMIVFNIAWYFILLFLVPAMVFMYKVIMQAAAQDSRHSR